MNPWIPHLLRASGGGGGGGGVVLPTAGRTMLANLKSSLILDVGTGNPAFSMATAYWTDKNDLGLLRQYPAGSAFFGGARLVRNLVPTPSNTLAVSGTKTVTLAQAATLQFSMGAGAGTATFSGTGGATGTLAAGASRVRVNKAVTAGTFIVTASVNALADLSIVDVTGYDASYVPEYVSVGVVSAPFFGANIDGAKYYNTDWQGAPLSAASLLGLRIEAAATNNLLWSRDFQSGLNNAKWVPSASGAEQLSLGTIGVFGTATAATYNTGTGAGTVTRVDGANQSYVLFSYNAIDVVKIAITNTGATDIYVRPVGLASSLIAVASGGSATGYVTGQVGYYITTSVGSGAFTITSLKKTDVQVTNTATGLDGIANTATTLTFVEADAIILQPTSGIASAARCASAYVKRRTGTGTISFTQNGGSTWTDITSLINSSTWSRVQITSTLANPSVGFKGGTLGDAIDVDVVQNEAGAVATSPIITTTAAVTRNANSLTYQTASNWSDTAGTAYIEAQPWQWSVGGLLGSATNGLLESASNSGATAYDGTNAANGPTGTPSGRKKLALRWNGATMDVSVGGVIGTAGTYDGAMGLASLGIAVNSSGYFGPAAVWNYAMTDDEFKALTT